MPIFGLPRCCEGYICIGLWSHCSGEGVHEKDHLFTVLEEKLDYPANLEESIRKKAFKAAISEIGTLQRRFKAHL
jgi:hypothetical protein